MSATYSHRFMEFTTELWFSASALYILMLVLVYAGFSLAYLLICQLTFLNNPFFFMVVYCSGSKWILNIPFGKCFIYVPLQKLCKFIYWILILVIVVRVSDNNSYFFIMSFSCLIFFEDECLIVEFYTWHVNFALDEVISTPSITNVSPLS